MTQSGPATLRNVVSEPSGTISPVVAARAEHGDVFGLEAKRRIGLRGDAERAAEEVEVVDVRRAQVDLERVEHVGRFDAEHLGLRAIDVGVDLRRAGAEEREDARETRRPDWRRR